MKTRNGFVSNSSSSSFMAAVKPGQKVRISKEINLETMASHVLRTVEELDKYKKEEWEEMGDKLYEKAKAALLAGKVIAVGSFDDQSGDAIECLLCNSGLRITDLPEEDILCSEGGY